ncbi:MAG TPA: glycosyltransferase 61 family protein [Microlunatus sp.]
MSMRARVDSVVKVVQQASRRLTPQDRQNDTGAGLFYAGLRSLLPTGDRLNVAVLATRESTGVPAVLDAFAGAKVRVFGRTTSHDWQLSRRRVTHVPSRHIGKTAWHFRRFGPFDVIINCAPAGKDGPLYAWRRLFLHLRANGAYVLDRSVLDEAEWANLTVELRKRAPIAIPDEEANTPEAELSAAIRDVAVNRDALVITKRNDHWLKLRNEDTDRCLPTRDVDATSRIILTVPKGTFASRAELQLHESTRPVLDFPSSFDYPQLYLHEYTGSITVASHSLLFCDHTILPESFRYQQVPILTNSRLHDPALATEPRSAPHWLQGFARVPEHLEAEAELDGRYYHLDCPYPGHFGHLMTEVVSRLWGWDQAKREDPELKAILRVHRGDRTPQLEKAIFTAYGIAPDDLLWVGHPVRVRSIVGATPMWQNHAPQYVHPEIADTWRRLGDNLIQHDVPEGELPEKIFVSRQPTIRRSCRNAAEVEAVFADRGFKIIYPETMDLAQQATVFSRARVVAGFGGSAMFNILFCRRLEKLIILAHESYLARNEYQFASVLGCQTHYLWSDPDHWHPEGGWNPAAFQSSWDFDFRRNGAALDKLI